jgi:hypothetical protein
VLNATSRSVMRTGVGVCWVESTADGAGPTSGVAGDPARKCATCGCLPIIAMTSWQSLTLSLSHRLFTGTKALRCWDQRHNAIGKAAPATRGPPPKRMTGRVGLLRRMMSIEQRLAAHPRRAVEQAAPLGQRRPVRHSTALTAPGEMTPARTRDAPRVDSARFRAAAGSASLYCARTV